MRNFFEKIKFITNFLWLAGGLKTGSGFYILSWFSDGFVEKVTK